VSFFVLFSASCAVLAREYPTKIILQRSAVVSELGGLQAAMSAQVREATDAKLVWCWWDCCGWYGVHASCSMVWLAGVPTIAGLGV